MVTALFVKNYTGLQFCCTAHLDSEQEEICNFMTDVKSIVKPGYCVRVAQLTRDYFFYGGVSHYFSFHLRVQGNKESVLVLKLQKRILQLEIVCRLPVLCHDLIENHPTKHLRFH